MNKTGDLAEKIASENVKKTIVYGKTGSGIEIHEKKLASIEKELIVFLVKALLDSGLGKNQLAVLAIYNLFKNKLEKRLKVLIFKGKLLQISLHFLIFMTFFFILLNFLLLYFLSYIMIFFMDI